MSLTFNLPCYYLAISWVKISIWFAKSYSDHILGWWNLAVVSCDFFDVCFWMSTSWFKLIGVDFCSQCPVDLGGIACKVTFAFVLTFQTERQHPFFVYCLWIIQKRPTSNAWYMWMESRSRILSRFPHLPIDNLMRWPFDPHCVAGL